MRSPLLPAVVLFVLCGLFMSLSSVVDAWPSSLSKAAWKTPQRATLLSVSPGGEVNHFFQNFIYAVTSQDMASVASMLTNDATGYVTPYRCSSLVNKSDLLAALRSLTSDVDVLSFIPTYHIVSNNSGAFWAQAAAFTTSTSATRAEARGVSAGNSEPPSSSSSSSWSSFSANVFFWIELTADKSLMKTFHYYAPAATQNADFKDVYDDLVRADIARDITVFENRLSADLQYAAYPEGQSYPATHGGFADVIDSVLHQFKYQQYDVFHTTVLFSTCEFLVTDYTNLLQLSNGASTGGNQKAIMRSASVLQMRRASPGYYEITAWTNFYWNNVTVWS